MLVILHVVLLDMLPIWAGDEKLLVTAKRSITDAAWAGNLVHKQPPDNNVELSGAAGVLLLESTDFCTIVAHRELL